MKSLLFVLALVGLPALAHAQDSTSSCGNLEDPAEFLDLYKEIFFDVELTDWRSTYGIQHLDPNVDAVVVDDQEVCDHLVAALIQELSKYPDWDGLHEDRDEFAFYKIGPYYVAHQRDKPPAGVITLSWSVNLLIFNDTNYGYITGITIKQ